MEISINVIILSLVGEFSLERYRGLCDTDSRQLICAEDRGTLQAGAMFRQSMTSSRRQNIDSLCTADLLASEVAGSWAMATPASAHGENDSSSAERVEPLMRRISDEGAEYVVSQVATNVVNAAAACNEGVQPPTTEADAAGDVDIDMSQTTTPKHNQNEPPRFQEQGAGNGMLNLTALSMGNFGRHHVVVDSSDTSSTEDGSREDGEIGASELRDSEPVSPLMYVQ